MSVSIPFLIIAVLVAALLGWLLRGFMQRTRPDDLAKLDAAGNSAAAQASSFVQKTEDTVKKQL